MMVTLFGTDSNRRFQKGPFLVVDWMTTGVALSEVQFESSQAVIRQSQFEKWPSEFEKAGAPEQIGKWLQQVCHKYRFPVSAVAVLVPRRELSLRLLELPRVSDDQLLPLVSLQVESRIQATGQPVAWDCLPHPALPGDSHRYVMLATVPSDTVEAIRKAATAAGWSDLRLTSGDLLMSNLQYDDSPWHFHVQANRGKLELLLSHRHRPLATYATAMPLDAPEAAAKIILSMSGRMLAGIPNCWRPAAGSPSEPMRPSFTISGSLAPSVSETLQSAAGELMPGESAVGKLTVQHPEDYSPRALAVARSLRSKSRSSSAGKTTELYSPCSIDFLRPRTGFLRSESRRRWIRTAVTASILLLSVFAGLWRWNSSLNEELALLEHAHRQQQLFVEQGQQTLEKWSYISRWQQSKIQAADEIRNITALLPARHVMFVTRLQLENVFDASASTVRIDGLAESAEEVLKMNARILNHSDHYDLRPQGIEPAPAGSVFPAQFRIETVLRETQSLQSETP